MPVYLQIFKQIFKITVKYSQLFIFWANLVVETTNNVIIVHLFVCLLL